MTQIQNKLFVNNPFLEETNVEEEELSSEEEIDSNKEKSTNTEILLFLL